MDNLRLCFLLSSLALFLQFSGSFVSADFSYGVNYGMLGDNLPSPSEVVDMYKRYNIKKMRIFDTNHAVMDALRGSGIEVIVGVRNQDLTTLAEDDDAINGWYSDNIEKYLNDVKILMISVGNEVIPGEYGKPVLAVMQRLHGMLRDKGVQIGLTTTLPGYSIAESYPPSASVFTDESRDLIVPVLKFMGEIGSTLLINIYPSKAYADSRDSVRLDYVMFTATEPVVTDGSLSYYNMYDAMIDAFYFAMEKEGVTNVNLGVAECGWPSGGNGDATTPELAQQFNKNMMKHVAACPGTPKRPNRCIEGFIFAMFNENQKPDGIEKYFGLFHPDKSPAYNVFG